MGVGLGNSMGPFRGPMSLGVPENPTDDHFQVDKGQQLVTACVS